ncbi:MAG: PASTA domain-containing protein, partial [Actinomycetota bacterium]|nr:PASTA domain-containing protein [Actinomycetota bacterium]
MPDADVSTGEPVEARVAAGGQVSVIALIRNQSGIVDNYDLSVIGLPEGWSTVAPPTVYLVPFGSRGTYEQEVHVQLHPPRSPDAEARAWAFEVSASSRAAEAEVASAAATLVVEPYQEIQLELRPERAGGRRKARFAVGVRNCANAPTEVDLGAIDTEEACGFQFDTPPEAAGAASRSGAGGALELGQRGERSARQAARLGNKAEALSQGGVDVGAKAKALARGRISSGGGFGALSGADGGGQKAPGHARLVVEAGERVETALTVLPPKPILVGRPLDRRLQVSAGPAAADAPPLVREATFRQRPWLPWWLPLALLLAVLLGLLVWMLLPKTATVPKVTGQKTVFSAGRVLKKEELKLGTVTPERRKGARPGAIVEQDPRAGEEADEGSAVDLVTVLGSKVRKVPKVVGLGLPDAEEKLVDRKFQLKSVRPEPDDPNKAKVVKQVPKAGARAREGTAVSLFVEAPKAPGQGGGGGGAGGAGKPGGGASSGGLAAGP